MKKFIKEKENNFINQANSLGYLVKFPRDDIVK